MANENSTPDVTFDADPTLEAKAGGGQGPADVEFEADPAIGESEAKANPVQQLKDEASRYAGQAADRAREFAGQGKERATGALDEVAKMFESAALDVDARLGEEYGRYARSAARGVSSFAESLRAKEVDDLIDDATALVKKSPAVAIGAAAAVGFVLARLIKSGIDAAADAGDRTSDA